MQGILKLIKTPSPWIPQNMTSQNRVKTLKPTSLSNTNNKKVRFVSELPSRDFVPGAGEPLVFGLPWLPGTHGDWTHLCCGDQLWYKLWRGISMRCLLEKPDAHRLGGGEDLNKKNKDLTVLRQVFRLKGGAQELLDRLTASVKYDELLFVQLVWHFIFEYFCDIAIFGFVFLCACIVYVADEFDRFFSSFVFIFCGSWAAFSLRVKVEGGDSELQGSQSVHCSDVIHST